MNFCNLTLIYQIFSNQTNSRGTDFLTSVKQRRGFKNQQYKYFNTFRMPRKKPFNYKIEDLVSEYNEDLYEEVSAKIPIRLEKQQGSWSAKIDEDGIAIIGYCKSNYPDAAFAHELLHIKAELSGLKDPYVRSDEPDVDWGLLRFFINQLAHHKIYPEFYDLGFTDDEFLNDNDFLEARILLRRDVPMIEKTFNKLGEPLEGLIILLPYLVCISPHETNEEISKFKERIIKISKPSFIETIDEIISEWTISNRMDYCLTLAKLFKACDKLKISFAPITDIENAISVTSV